MGSRPSAQSAGAPAIGSADNKEGQHPHRRHLHVDRPHLRTGRIAKAASRVRKWTGLSTTPVPFNARLGEAIGVFADALKEAESGSSAVAGGLQLSDG